MTILIKISSKCAAEGSRKQGVPFFFFFFCFPKQLTRTRLWRVSAHGKTRAQSADEWLSRCSANRTRASQGEGWGVGGWGGCHNVGVPPDMTLWSVSGTNAFCWAIWTLQLKVRREFLLLYLVNLDLFCTRSCFCFPSVGHLKKKDPRFKITRDITLHVV